MAPKSLVLAALLTVVVAAGQVTRCAGLGASPNASVVISGAVPCSTGNNINVATAPAFPSKAYRSNHRSSLCLINSPRDIIPVVVHA